MARSTNTDRQTELPTMVKDGREWTPESRAEVVNLRARGWTVKTEGKASAPANKSASSSSK